MEKGILTLEDAAELLEVPPRALRAAAARGEVPGRRIAGRWRFSRRALHAWLGHEHVRSDAWAEFAGAFAGDPLFEEAMANIAAERERQRRSEAGAAESPAPRMAA